LSRGILVLGFGRMGLSHASQYNLLKHDAPRMVSVFDPSKKLAMALRYTRKFHRIEPMTELDKGDLSDFECVFVCSPPLVHASNLRDLSGYRGKIFVEKPGFFDAKDLLGLNYDKIYVGYVLRHAPAIKRIKSASAMNTFQSLEITLTTNADFSGNEGNWRDQAHHGGGLINEFGSHCVNLLLYLVSDNELTITAVNSSSPNDVELVFAAARDFACPKFVVRLAAGRSEVRKAVYTVDGLLNDGTRIWTDFSTVKTVNTIGVSNQEEHRGNTVSLASGQLSSAAYLRGHEFSNQMVDFIDRDTFVGSVEDSMATDDLLRQAHDFIDARR
jgi:predicted dehydrogenase